MSEDRIPYEEMQERLDRAEATLSALRRGEVDLVIGNTEPLVVRFKTLVEEKERLLFETEQLAKEWQTTFDSVKDTIWLLDTHQRVLRSNKSVEQVFHCSIEDVLGRPCWEIVHGTDEPIPDCPIMRMQESMQRETLEMQIDERWFEIMVDPILDTDNQYTGAVHIISDITDRKLAERERERLAAQVREQARELEQIMETVPMGVLLLDAGRRVLQANPVAVKDLAALAGARMGDTLTHLGGHPLADLLALPSKKGLWHEVKASNGQIFEIIARPMEDGQQSENYVLVVNDVTQEREIRTQLQQQERLAAVGQLAAGIAHDFNNIMASIVLYAQMLAQSQDLSKSHREKIEVINQQAWHASRLIEQILDFSRRGVLEPQSLDLLPLLKEQVKLLARTLPEHITIELIYAQDGYTVFADPTRIQQMLTNLAVNARDAMPDGGRLRIELEQVIIEQGQLPRLPEMADGEWVRLAVSDTGMGIVPDVLPYIFEPFFTTKGPGQGSGLGLAQVHGIVGQHGGHISVETEAGEGATFSIYLPLLKGISTEKARLEASGIPQGQGELLLVVEDEATLRAALAAGLEKLNYRVLEAANGEQALAVMAERGGKIALVLSDVIMPVMGGMALLHAMREKGWEMPVVLLTGHPMGKELDDLRQRGLVTWLTKPYRIENLAQMIYDALHA